MKIIAGAVISLGLLVACASYKIVSAQPMASWHMVNVNARHLQGDANVIEIGNKVVMIDAGYKSEADVSLIPYLRQKGINYVHHFYVSHPHRDHYEGVAALWNEGIPIDNIYYNMPADGVSDCCYDKRHFQIFLDKAKQRGSKIKNVSKGHILDLPYKSTIEVLHAQKSAKLNSKGLDVNDMSLIMRWRINGFKILFTGDLNRRLGTYLSDDSRMKADFLKVPHHGAYGIAPDSFFDAVSPKFVMVPGRKAHWCGERGAQAKNWTDRNKLPHWVNGLHGNVRVDFNLSGGNIYREKNDSCGGKELKKQSSFLNPYPFNKKSDIMPIIMTLLLD